MTKVDRILRMEKMIEGAKDMTNDQLVKFIFDKVLNKKLSLKTNDMLDKILQRVLPEDYRYEEILVYVRQMLYKKEDKDYRKFYNDLKNANLATSVASDGRKISDYYYYQDHTSQDEIDLMKCDWDICRNPEIRKVFKRLSRIATKEMIEKYLTERYLEMSQIKRQAS